MWLYHSAVTSITTPEFASPITTQLDELIRLQALAAIVTSRKRRTAAKQLGAAPSKHFGRGLDFAEVREYHAGDEVRMMDWNVTARTGRAHTKVFTEERERPVIFVVDQTASMHFGTRGMFKSAMAVRLAGLLAWCALAAGDRMGGLIAFDNTVQRIRPAGQRRGLLNLLQAMASSQMHERMGETLQTDSPLVLALQQVRTMAPSGSRVVLISDFQSLDDPLEQHIQGLLRRVEFTPICVHDAIEVALPDQGVLPIRARGTNSAVAVLDTSASARAKHRAQVKVTTDHINSLFLNAGQAVSHVQSHDVLTTSAMHAWFGVRTY